MHNAVRSAAPREISRDDVARRYGEMMWRARGDEASPFVLYAVLRPADCVMVPHIAVNRSISPAPALSPGDPPCPVRTDAGKAGERVRSVTFVTFRARSRTNLRSPRGAPRRATPAVTDDPTWPHRAQLVIPPPELA